MLQYAVPSWTNFLSVSCSHNLNHGLVSVSFPETGQCHLTVFSGLPGEKGTSSFICAHSTKTCHILPVPRQGPLYCVSALPDNPGHKVSTSRTVFPEHQHRPGLGHGLGLQTTVVWMESDCTSSWVWTALQRASLLGEVVKPLGGGLLARRYRSVEAGLDYVAVLPPDNEQLIQTCAIWPYLPEWTIVLLK